MMEEVTRTYLEKAKIGRKQSHQGHKVGRPLVLQFWSKDQ